MEYQNVLTQRGLIMKNTSFKLSRMAMFTGLALSAMFIAPSFHISGAGDQISLASLANAQEDGGGSKGKGSKGGTGMGQRGSVGEHGQVKGTGNGQRDIMMKGQGGPGEDSDRPAWAGVKGGKSGGGGKPADGGTKKGDLYGDLYVLIRDPVTGAALTETIIINGVPTVFPLVQAFDKTTGALLPGVKVPRDAEGNLITTDVVTAEVDFGRLSVSRSPSKVTDHSLTEALSKLSDPTATISLDPAGRLVVTVNGVASAIDSPLENLALYKAISNLTGTDRTISVSSTAKDGTGTSTYTFTIPTSINIDQLKASLLAAAGDKSGTITLDTVMYINPILGVTSDLSTFNYDRASTYANTTVTVLVKQADGVTYVATPVNVYEAVFKSTNDTTSTGAADFATATNDALQVLEFVHDNAVR